MRQYCIKEERFHRGSPISSLGHGVTELANRQRVGKRSIAPAENFSVHESFLFICEFHPHKLCARRSVAYAAKSWFEFHEPKLSSGRNVPGIFEEVWQVGSQFRCENSDRRSRWIICIETFRPPLFANL